MMPSPVSTADSTPPPAAADGDQDVAQDGWRAGGLPALRAELDRIDDTLHDLLMQRARIVEHVARSGKPAAFRPGREASIIRRLLRRHHGALPPASVVRVWRELLAATTAMQGGFSVAVVNAGPVSIADTSHTAAFTQLAREHFGALTPLRAYASPGQALLDVSHGAASVAVLPYPSETDTWWVALLHHEPRLHIICRLPFWSPRPDGAPNGQALVIAATPVDASGEDQSFLGLECDTGVSRDRLSTELSRAGLTPRNLLLVRPPAASMADVLVEISGYLDDSDPRLTALGSMLRHPVVLGTYAVPISGDAR